MPLSLYNTLTRRKDTLPLPSEESIRLYTCGPTVYNRVHIGNLRAFTTYDVLRRTLEWFGYDVKHVMNITDVDDKTIRDSRKEGVSLQEFTERYTLLFLEDMDALRIKRPHALPRATEAIDAMVKLVETLLEKRIAYKSPDGSVYFKISAFPAYGELSQLDTRALEAGAGGRVTSDEYEKDNVQDFALWKAWSEEDGDVGWETSLGKGRPGWHLECSALAMEHLGATVDIHAGGVDLIFPHHENEIAQSQAATDQQFAKYWVHNEHLLVGGKKMSKSLGNFYTLKDLQTQARATPREVRYALISAHYRSHLNFQVTYEGEGSQAHATSFDSIEDARRTLRRLDNFRLRLEGSTGGDPATPLQKARLQQARDEFAEALGNDLNVPQGLAAIFALENDLKKGELGSGFAQGVLQFLEDADRVLGVLQPEAEADLPPEAQALFERWITARNDKEWSTADAVRDELKAMGIGVKAAKDGASWYRL